MLNVDSKNAEIKLRYALTEHHSVYGHSNVIGYRQLYSQYPTAFEGMTHTQMLEVADAVHSHALMYKDTTTSNTFSPLIIVSKTILVKDKIEAYIGAAMCVTSAGEKLFTKEDMINALYFGKYQI